MYVHVLVCTARPVLLMTKYVRVVEVRDSRTGYLLPARDTPGVLPDGQSCWDAAAVVVAVSCQNVTLISFSFRA